MHLAGHHIAELNIGRLWRLLNDPRVVESMGVFGLHSTSGESAA